MNDFDDLLTGALGARGDGAPIGAPNSGDAVRRARHHRAVRRTVAASSVAVLAFAGVAGLVLRSPDNSSPVADAPEVDTPQASSCAEGQIQSAEGDIVLHDGRPYSVAAGQCLTATLQEPTITTCEVSDELGDSDSSDSGSGDSDSGVVSSGAEGKGCVVITGQACAAPPLDVPTVTSIATGPGQQAPDAPTMTCTMTSCGGFTVFPGPAMTPDGPVMTAFVDANSDGEFDSDSVMSDEMSELPNVVEEACAAGAVPDVITQSDVPESTVTMVEVQG